MSAYIVDNNHIAYLLRAATSPAITLSARMTWAWRTADSGDLLHAEIWAGAPEQRFRAVGNMLLQANVDSVSTRYAACKHTELPGAKGQTLFCDFGTPIPHFNRIKAVEVLKSCDCYEYQSCEHSGWRNSQANAFVTCLRSCAIDKLAGYEEAPWGAPEPCAVYYGNLQRLA